MNEISHYTAMAICILLVPVAQTLMKLGTDAEDTISHSLLRPQVLAGLAILWLVTVLSVYSFQVVEMKTSTAWTSLTYILVTLSASLVLKEKVRPIRWLGCSLIVAGILVFQLG